MAEILNLNQDITIGDQQFALQEHHYYPFTPANLGCNDEIRISVSNQDIYTLPAQSHLFIQGQILKEDGTTVGTAKLVPNGIAHLFEEVRLNLANVEIDRARHVGVLSTIRNYLLLNKLEANFMECAGWDNTDAITKDGVFTAHVPLRSLLGFGLDFDRIICNSKLDLILLRSKDDKNALKGDDAAAQKNIIKLTKVYWSVPHVTVSDEVRLKFLEVVKKDIPLRIAFRSWEIYDIPLSESVSDSWSVATHSQLEKPRFIIFAAQTGKRGDQSKDNSTFDHLNFQDVRVHINGECIPYHSLNLDFKGNQYLTAYLNYARMKNSFLNTHGTEPLLSYAEFKEKANLLVFDCTKSNESIKSGPVDTRIRWQTDGTKIAKSSIAYAVLVHDRLIEYHPLHNTVRKLI